MTNQIVKTAIACGILLALSPSIAPADPEAKQGVTPYVTHFVFRPIASVDIAGLGTATSLEAIGSTATLTGEKMSTNRSRNMIAARTSSPAVPENMRVSPGASRSIASHCLRPRARRG
jgi:hypothetical protein